MRRLAGQTGWVNWPTLPHDRWHDTGEGGMWVHAFWPGEYTVEDTSPAYEVDPDRPRDTTLLTRHLDPFVRCHGAEATICLPLADAPVSDNVALIYPSPAGEIPDRDADLEGHLTGMYDAGVAVLAAVCLGTTATSYADAAGGYWQCTADDLNAEGRTLLRLLTMLYHRSPVLVTYLDT